MADTTQDLATPELRPFTTFRFRIEIDFDSAGTTRQVCAAAFSECDGLEMTIEPKTIREGGRNTGPVHLIGPVSYGQLTLKRGMTENFDLWTWFERVAAEGGGGYRTAAEVLLLSSDITATEPDARFRLEGCLPVKLRAPSLNAREGLVAIEEMQIAYESLVLRPRTQPTITATIR
jgi:phage tail-like protein